MSERERMREERRFLDFAEKYDDHFERVSFKEGKSRSVLIYTALLGHDHPSGFYIEKELKLYRDDHGGIGFITEIKFEAETLHHAAIPLHMVFKNKYLSGGFGLYKSDFIENVKGYQNDHRLLCHEERSNDNRR